MEKLKTPKSQLKELEAQYQKLGAKLQDSVFREMVDENDPLKRKKFFCTCKFIKMQGGTIFEGEGEAASKKLAEHEACQKILDKLSKAKNEVVQNNVIVAAPREPETFQSSILQNRSLSNDGNTYVVASSLRSLPSTSVRSSDVTIMALDESKLDTPEILEEAIKNNVIGKLQEFCVQNKLANPAYSETGWIGADNKAGFKWTCEAGDTRKYGIALVKMNAKKIAAYKVLQYLTETVKTVVYVPQSSQKPASVRHVRSMNNVPSRATTKITDKIFYYTNFRIGEGGTANVYEGYFEMPTRKAAIKISPKEIIHHEKNKELAILRRLNHPNIVTYYTTEDIGLETFIVMELAQCTLEDVIRSKRITDRKLLINFCSDTTKGLMALHQSNIIHRDLKPSNVLIFPGNVAKLADFGISKELDSISEGVVTEAFRGTRIWMPPEGLKAIGSPEPFVLLPSFDIFALGLTMFFTMTEGKHIFASSDFDPPMQIQSHIINYQPNWNWLVTNEFTALKNLLGSMISVHPSKRPDSSYVMEHPFFWDDKKSLDFLLAVSNDLKNNQKGQTSTENRDQMTRMYQGYCNQSKQSANWKSRLHPKLQEFIQFKEQMKVEKKVSILQVKKYKDTSLLKLIEFIRDYYQHSADWEQFENGVLKQSDVFGENGNNYGTYFLNTFPELTTLLYTLFQDLRFHGLQLQPFYTLNTKGCYERW